MRKFLILLVLFPVISFSQRTISYHGNELKIYPFEQEKKIVSYYYSKQKDGKMKKSDRPIYQWSGSFKRSEVFLPLGELEDGTYLQLAKPELSYYKEFKWDKVQHFNYKIPFAISTVKNNKLNGPAYFLSVNGDTIARGHYKDNLADGRWQSTMDERAYTTFKNDTVHGPYFRVPFEKFKRKKLIAIKYESGNYFQGRCVNYFQVDSSIRGYKTKEMYTIDTLNKIKVYTTTHNGVVTSKGRKKGWRPFGEWNYYNYDSTIKSTLNYTGDTIRDDRMVKEWVEGLAAHPLYFNSINFQGIKIYDQRRYGGYLNDLNLYVSPRYTQSFSGVECFGEEIFYHSNGVKQFSYQIENGKIIMDTVFSGNGTPFFFMKEDIKTQEYVLEYFDYYGKKIDEKRIPFEQNTEQAYFKLMYKGLELYSEQLLDLYPSYSIKNKRQYLNKFYYDERPSYEQAVAAGDTTFYTYLCHNGVDLLHEVYYIFGERVRIEKQYSNALYETEKSPVLIERRDYFNDDFTECHTILSTVFDDKFRVLEEYDISYESNFYKNELYREVKGKKRNLKDYNIDFFPNSKGHFRIGNFKDPVVQVSNYSVSYTMNGSPFTGDVNLSFNKNGQKLNFKDEKLKLQFYSTFGEYRRGAQYSQDRFGIEYLVTGINIIPDFASQMPSGNSDLFKSLGQIKGSFIEGKKEGDWIFKNSFGKTIVEANFKNDKLDGELRTYYYQKKKRKSNRYDWYSGGSTDEEYYLNSRSFFKNGQIVSYEAFNIVGRKIAGYEYKNGEPSKGWCLENENYWFEDIFSDSMYIEVANNELTKLDVVNFAKDNKLDSYKFKDDEFDGLYINDLDSGYWEKGKYTGVFANNIGYDRIKKEFIMDNIMYKLEIRSPENYKLLQLTYDTLMVRLSGSAYKRFYISDHVKFQKSDTTLSDLGMPLEAQFTSYYDNQQIHAEGVLANGIETDKKGIWKYYNPDGELMSEIEYLNYTEQAMDEDNQYNYGTLIQYQNGAPIYKARITMIFEKYNCASADNYEIRQLKILEDYKNDDTIVKPTRYHKTYYDMGVLQSEGEIVNGLAQGIWKFYDREGGLSEVGMYLDGKRTGRWLKGDLTGLGFIGDFCLAADNYEINANQLKKNVRLEILNYSRGKVMKKTELNASRND